MQVNGTGAAPEVRIPDLDKAVERAGGQQGAAGAPAAEGERLCMAPECVPFLQS